MGVGGWDFKPFGIHTWRLKKDKNPLFLKKKNNSAWLGENLRWRWKEYFLGLSLKSDHTQKVLKICLQNPQKEEKNNRHFKVQASLHKTPEGKHVRIFPYLYSLILPIVQSAVLSAGGKILPPYEPCYRSCLCLQVQKCAPPRHSSNGMHHPLRNV